MQKPIGLSLNSGATASLKQGKGTTWLVQQATACQSNNNRIFKAQAHSATMLPGLSIVTMHGSISFASIKPARLEQAQPFHLAQDMLLHAWAWWSAKVQCTPMLPPQEPCHGCDILCSCLVGNYYYVHVYMYMSSSIQLLHYVLVGSYALRSRQGSKY